MVVAHKGTERVEPNAVNKSYGDKVGAPLADPSAFAQDGEYTPRTLIHLK